MAEMLAEGNAHGSITAADVTTRGPARAATFSDEAALRLVVQDASRFETWLDSNQWKLDWHESDVLYQSPRTTQRWGGAGAARANVTRFTVAKHVNSLVPMVMSGIFYDEPPFVLRPRPGTTQLTVRAKSALFAALLADIDFKGECEAGIESQVNKGTGMWKWGCYTETTIERQYVRKKAPRRVSLPFGAEMQVHTAESDEFEVREVERSKWRPFFEWRPLGEVLVDPAWRHPNRVWRAKAVIDRQYLNFYDLNKLRERDGYHLPEEAELKKWFEPPGEVALSPSNIEQMQAQNSIVHHAEGRDKETTEDPLAKVLKVDERWDAQRVMIVVQDKYLIRNEEHGLGCIPFLSANWWNIEKAGYGMGVGRLVGSDQRVEQGATNAALDLLSAGVNPSYVRANGSNASTQQLVSRLGGIINVDVNPGQKVRDVLELLEVPKVPPEVWQAIQNAKNSAESVSGADEAMVQGSLPQRGGSSLGRTATGAGNLAAASAARIQGPVGKFVDNVFVPFLRHLDKMVKEHMPMAEIRAILGEVMADAADVDYDNFLNSNLTYEVLAGAHLAAKKAMSQALPWMIQILENPHMLQSLNQTGWTVDIREIYAMILEVAEWKNSRTLIREMTAKEKAMFEQVNSPQVQKQQGDIAKIQAQGAVDAQLTDQKAEAKLASKITEDAFARAGGYAERQALERAMGPGATGTAATTSTGA